MYNVNNDTEIDNIIIVSLLTDQVFVTVVKIFTHDTPVD